MYSLNGIKDKDMNHQYQSGFTLIELMVVVASIAILAAIAIPSYRVYVIRNAEADVQKKMMSLSTELEQWRAKALTYKGFKPRSDTIDGSGNINFPVANPRYTIKLGQLNGSSFELLDGGSGRGISWIITAEPTERVTGGSYYLFKSNGLKCSSTQTIPVNVTECPTGSESW